MDMDIRMHLPIVYCSQYTHTILRATVSAEEHIYCSYTFYISLIRPWIGRIETVEALKVGKIKKSNLVQVRRAAGEGGHGRAGQDLNRGGTRPLLSFLVVRDNKGMWRIRLFGMGLGKGCRFGNGKLSCS